MKERRAFFFFLRWSWSHVIIIMIVPTTYWACIWLRLYKHCPMFFSPYLLYTPQNDTFPLIFFTPFPSTLHLSFLHKWLSCKLLYIVINSCTGTSCTHTHTPHTHTTHTHSTWGIAQCDLSASLLLGFYDSWNSLRGYEHWLFPSFLFHANISVYKHKYNMNWKTE